MRFRFPVPLPEPTGAQIRLPPKFEWLPLAQAIVRSGDGSEIVQDEPLSLLTGTPLVIKKLLDTVTVGVPFLPVTQLPLEQGQNALPADEQAWQHCVVIEQQQGILAADVMRERVKAHIKLRTEAHNVAVKAALEQIK